MTLLHFDQSTTCNVCTSSRDAGLSFSFLCDIFVSQSHILELIFQAPATQYIFNTTVMGICADSVQFSLVIKSCPTLCNKIMVHILSAAYSIYIQYTALNMCRLSSWKHSSDNLLLSPWLRSHGYIESPCYCLSGIYSHSSLNLTSLFWSLILLIFILSLPTF